MKLNSKGQVTIPAALRTKHGVHEGDEIEVIDDGGAIGAHAAICRYELLTRDAARYRSYFPRLTLITPAVSES